jgi:hypothetical protein
MGAALGGGLTIEQKLDDVLPVLIELMSLSTNDLLNRTTERLSREGYQFVNGKLVLVRRHTR